MSVENTKKLNMNKFATAINCMDGRVQLPVIQWLKKEYGINYVDMITEPGPNKVLAECKENAVIDSIKKRVDISVNKHNSKLIAIVGHYDCAGNPAEKDTQLKHIITAIKMVKLWNFGVKVIGLWVDENWNVHNVGDL